MRPLEGLRVVDLTRVLSGPYCTMQLGDLGAEVIKVERPGEGDDTRAFAPPFQGDQAAYFLSVNRNKKSITLDMKSEPARRCSGASSSVADVLVENFRPGAMDRLGLGYDAVKARRPAMVYCSISGFGDTGIQKDRPGYDVIVQGEAGVMDITGPRDGAPHKVGVAVGRSHGGLERVARHTGRALHVQVHRARPACAHLHVRGRRRAPDLQRQHLLRDRQLAAPARQRAPHHRALRNLRGSRRLDQPRRRQRRPLAAVLPGSGAARAEDRPSLRQGVRSRAQSRGARAARQGHCQRALARRVAEAPGQGRRAERGHPHGRRGVRGRRCSSRATWSPRCRIRAPAW